MTEETTAVLYIRSLPRRIKREFKSWCDRHEITMTSAIIEFMALSPSIMSSDMIAHARTRDDEARAR